MSADASALAMSLRLGGAGADSGALARPLSRRKGLTNDLGENNCFLNVIIQSLWHIRSFRVLIATGDHAVHHRCGGHEVKHKFRAANGVSDDVANRTGGSCLLCELERIFVLYQFAEDPVLEVDRVRVALGSVFEVGAMNDATETLEAILDALHWDTFNRMLMLRRGQSFLSVEEMSQSTVEDASAIVCAPQCVAHLLFQMNLMEYKSCPKCFETSEPLMNTDFLYRVYAQELMRHAPGRTLEEVLQLEAQGLNDGGVSLYKCDNCHSSMQFSRWILTLPMVFAISIIWSSDQVNKAEIKTWMDLLSSQSKRGKAANAGDPCLEDQQTLDLGQIFRLGEDDDQRKISSLYGFRGMVCYYGRHYVGFFASRSMEDGVEKERWFLFDDTRVKRVGAWEDVRSRIERGGYQPTLLFYERKDLRLDHLEKMANTIHSWWKETAEKEEKDQREEREAHAKTKAASNDVSSPDDQNVLLNSTLAQPISQKPGPSSSHIPTSPIKAPQSGIPDSLTSNNGKAWLEEDLYLMHLSGEDTLSRLNGILQKEKVTGATPPPSSGSLRMSMSMPRSIRKREYSVKNLSDAADNVNRDEIFQDVGSHSSSPPRQLVFDRKAVAEAKRPGSDTQSARHYPLDAFDVTLRASDGGIGLLLDAVDGKKSGVPQAKHSFVVSGFELNGAKQKLAAQASGAIEKGDFLVGINGQIIGRDEDLYQVLEMLWTAPNPVQLRFHRFCPWACPVCTLENEPTTTTCAACGRTVEAPTSV